MKKTEAGKEILDYFNSAKRNCYVVDDNGRTSANGTENVRGEVKGWSIYINRNNDDYRRIPTIWGSDPSNSPLWVVVGHEMAHAKDYLDRGVAKCKNNWAGFFDTEKYATHMENRMRAEAGLPLRTHYDKNVPESAILQKFNGIFLPKSSYKNDSGNYYYYLKYPH